MSARGAESARFEPAGDFLGRNVGDVRLAAVELLDLCRVDIEPDCVEAGPDVGIQQRQADVAEADHADDRFVVANFLGELCGGVGGDGRHGH